MTRPSNVMNSQTRQSGLSLIELMIGIALSLLILTAVLYSFAGSQASYRYLTSSSAVQESGRIALEVLNRDLRMTGNSGCGNINSLQHSTPALFSNPVALQTAPGASGTVPDGITVRYGSALSTNLANSPAANQIELVSLAALGGSIIAGNVLLLSDCIVTEAVTVLSVSGNVITTAANLLHGFRPGSTVTRLETVAYTVNMPTNELWRNGQAVAAGVTNMQILYGVSGPADRGALEYIEAPSVASAPQVVAVKLALTVADGANVSQPFFSTTTLRNRAP
jgi:type IV pilus assembly protein PilW